MLNIRQVVPLLGMLVVALPVDAQQSTPALVAGAHATQERSATSVGSAVRITIALEGVSIEAALRAIARNAKLQLAVDKSVLPKRLVTVKFDNIRADAALERVLAGTGLVAHIDRSGMLSVAEGGWSTPSRT